MKLAVSIGPNKYPRAYFHQSVKEVKKELKKLGYSVVSGVNSADLVIVPNNFSEHHAKDYPHPFQRFSQFLHNHRRPPKKEETINIREPSQKELENRETRELMWDEAFIEQRLKEEDPSFKVDLEEKDDYVPDKIPFQPIRFKWDDIYPILEELRKPCYPNYLAALSEEKRFFYPSLYLQESENLEKMKNLIQHVDVFFQDVHQNVHLLSKKKISVHKSPKWSWSGYRELLDLKKCQILFQHDLLENMSDALIQEYADYFARMESFVYGMKKQTEFVTNLLEEKRKKWTLTIRLQFASSCKESKEKCVGMCYFVNEECMQKPFVFIMDDLVWAFSWDDVPMSHPDLKHRQQLYDLFKTFYERRFSSDAVQDFPKVYDKSIFVKMRNELYQEIKDELEFHHDKEILWSHVADLLDLSKSEWNLLWDKDASVQGRKNVISVLKHQLSQTGTQQWLKDMVISFCS